MTIQDRKSPELLVDTLRGQQEIDLRETHQINAKALDSVSMAIWGGHVTDQDVQALTGSSASTTSPQEITATDTLLDTVPSLASEDVIPWADRVRTMISSLDRTGQAVLTRYIMDAEELGGQLVFKHDSSGDIAFVTRGDSGFQVVDLLELALAKLDAWDRS